MQFPSCVILLGSLTLTACTQPAQVEIPFSLTYHGKTLNCDNAVENVSLKDFRFYLHDIQLKSTEGQWHSLQLNEDQLWQNASTALIDFENGNDGCELGTKDINSHVSGSLPQAQYEGIRFVVGVPFEFNHQNPLTAKAPLNESTMHWHWQSGYKFLRAEFAYQDNPRRIHLGSLRCKGEIDNISHCEAPNRPTIELTQFKPGQDNIEVVLDGLFDHIAQLDAPKVTCMGDDEKPWCDNSLDWIGLGDKPQTAFKLKGGAL